MNPFAKLLGSLFRSMRDIFNGYQEERLEVVSSLTARRLRLSPVRLACPDHGPTFLRDGRYTECCMSMSWCLASKVVSWKERPVLPEVEVVPPVQESRNVLMMRRASAADAPEQADAAVRLWRRYGSKRG